MKALALMIALLAGVASDRDGGTRPTTANWLTVRMPSDGGWGGCVVHWNDGGTIEDWSPSCFIMWDVYRRGDPIVTRADAG